MFDHTEFLTRQQIQGYWRIFAITRNVQEDVDFDDVNADVGANEINNMSHVLASD